MVDVRVTLDKLQSLYVEKAGVRVTRVQTSAIYQDKSNAIRVTRVQFSTMYPDKTNPPRVTRFMVQSLVSVAQAPPEPEALPDIDRIIPELLDREANPYRPTLPEEVREVNPVLHDFMAESVGITREQHNKTQAGDSTVGWEFLTKVGPEKLYTLGSLGRFFHDDYGLILARYVQFTKMAAGDWIQGPVGRLKDSSTVDWKVTNNTEFSDPHLVLGILGSYTMPEEGWYGWVLTQGANHVQLRLPAGTVPTTNQQLVWHSHETLATTGFGRIIARALGGATRLNASENCLEPGAAFIELEGPSIDSLWGILGDKLQVYVDQIEAIQQTLENADLANLIPNLNKLLETVKDHEVRLDELEAGGFKAKIEDLQRRLTAIETGGQIDALYSRIMGEINPQLLDIRDRLTNLTEQVNAIPNWGPRISALEELVAQLQNAANRTLIPLVDGSVPPNLVYLPTGELVFVEIEL